MKTIGFAILLVLVFAWVALGQGTATKTLTITVRSGLSITTATLNDAVVGSAYSATLAASGGISPYTWSVTSGTLPTGLTLASATGVIGGTPTAAGAYSFTVQVKDSSTAIAYLIIKGRVKRGAKHA
jgi:lipoprotein-anchoring transpeptidase ErfK/SrfK